MIKAVIIDDEVLAIKKLEYVLEGFEDVRLEGCFTEAAAALEKIEAVSPNLVFLDIEMPGMDGFELAITLARKIPEAEVVFVTAHDEYAVDAFEIAAFDYLLKPVTRERMAKTLQRLKSNIGMVLRQEAEGRACISCFGSFEVIQAGGAPVSFSSSKVKELFAYLVSQHGAQVKKEIIMEALWPEVEYDKALVNLNTCIYQLRRLIAKAQLDIEVVYRSGCYMMKLGNMELDTELFMKLINSFKAEKIYGRSRIEELIASYKGGYMEHERYSWTFILQQQYYKRYKEAILSYVFYCMENSRYSTAAEAAEELIRSDEFCEEAWEVLIEAYLKKGTKALAIKAFERYSRVLEEELGVEPGARIKELLGI